MPPALTFLSVAIEETDKPVVTEMIWAIRIIIMVPMSPALPTTHPNLRYIITPRMVSTEGTNTPPKVPNFWALAIEFILE
jgi:hypothetical protein